MDETLREIFVEVFNIQPVEYVDALSPDTLIPWDSLGHIRLVTAMEERFKLTFATTEIMDMINVASIKDILTRRTVPG